MQLSIKNLPFHLHASLLLTLALILFGDQALASHQANEPTDGTVNSFRWLKNPLPMPHVSIQHWQGDRVSLSQFKGKVVLLNLWASWCPPCVRELPALNRLQQRFGGEDFVVIAVSLDRDPELARIMFFDRLALTHLKFYIAPPEQLGKFLPVDVLPSNFILDRKGRVIGLLRSFVDWGSPDADKFVKQLLAGTEPTNPGAE